MVWKENRKIRSKGVKIKSEVRQKSQEFEQKQK